MEFFDPVYFFGSENYSKIVAFIISALKNGILSRLLSAIFMLLGLWLVWRRKQVPAGLITTGVSVFFAFVGQVFWNY